MDKSNTFTTGGKNMKNFKKVTSPEIIKKQIIETLAGDKPVYSEFLKPEDKFIVCNCRIKNTKYSTQKLLTGVKYPTLGWEHILVRTQNRYPTYREMIYAKNLFWYEKEIAFQIFPPKSQYVNLEEYTLHLWRFAKISPNHEKKLYQKLLKQYEELEKYEYGVKKSILLEDETFGKRVLVFGDMCWPKWEELREEKSKYWNEEEAAILFHLSAKIDGNRQYVIILWDGKGFPLPPKKMV